MADCRRATRQTEDLLATSRFKRSAEAGEHFDFVVVDGPPVLGRADSSRSRRGATAFEVVESAARATSDSRRDQRVETSARTLSRVETKATTAAALATVTVGYGDGQGTYKYGVGKNQNEILMIPHQGDS